MFLALALIEKLISVHVMIAVLKGMFAMIANVLMSKI
jgi:hypothetical protein